MEHNDEINSERSANNGLNHSADNPSGQPGQPHENANSCEAASVQPLPNTAIERQMARAGYRKQNYRLTPNRSKPARKKTPYSNGPYGNNPYAERRRFRPAVLTTGIFLLLLGSGGLIFIASDRNHAVQNTVARFLKSQFVEDIKSTISSRNRVPTPSPSTNENAIATPSNNPAIAVPISDISLQRRPEFLAQLVQVYRAQLASNPNDSQALTALAQLQERSLSELQTIISLGDAVAAQNSMSVATRIFPEFSSNSRYLYLLTRMDYMQHQSKDEAIAKTEPSDTSPANNAASATSTPSTQSEPSPTTTIRPQASAPISTTPVTAPVAATSAQATAAATTPEPAMPAKKVATPAPNASPATSKPESTNTAALKPEIRAVSVTPGTMVSGQFVPSDEGNLFLVEIGYRNFDKAFIDKNEATLVTRLGVPGDSTVLAEVPLVITADRGTTSFVAETYVQSSLGGKLQLNFLLNDEFLTSRTLRISMPRRAAVEN